MENNNKESFQLLAGHSGSDSGSEIQEFALPQRKRRVKRRIRGRVSRDGSSVSDPGTCCCCGSGPRGRAWRLGLGISLLGGWMLALSWVALSAHRDVAGLDLKLQTVSSSSDGVSNELYQCRSTSRQLQLNQSHLAGKLENLTAQLNNITVELNAVTAGLAEVQKRVKEAPQLVAVPKQLSDLSTSVANLGSQIQDLRTTTTQLQAQGTSVVTNITQLQVSVDSLNASSQAQKNAQTGTGSDGEQAKVVQEAQAQREAMLQRLQEQISSLATNLTQVNTSLTGRMQWNLEDTNKHHKSIEALQEIGQNMSARVTTLEGQCNALTSKHELLEKNVTQLNSLVSGTSSRTAQLETRVGSLQEVYGELQALQANTQTRLEHLEPQVTSVVPSVPAAHSTPSVTIKPLAVATVPSHPPASIPGPTITALPAEG